MSAELRITSDPADVLRTLRVIATEGKKTSRELVAEARKASTDRRKIENDEIRQTRADLKSMQRDRVRAARDKIQLEKDGAKETARLSKEAKQLAEAAYKDKKKLVEKELKDVERIVKDMLAARKRANDEARRSDERAHQARLSEMRRMAAAQRQMQSQREAHWQREGELAGARRDLRQQRRDRNWNRVGAVAGGAGAALSMLSDFGDNAAEQAKVKDRLELRATQIAAGDIGDPRASRELLSATQRVSTTTGMHPDEVLEAIAEVQQNFSTLADSAQRATYLTDVLPRLASAAEASGASLTDMVKTAGEFQRQMGVRTEDLPAAMAQYIAGGRLGSITASETAHSFGAIGGRASRFLSSNPNNALANLAATNALFQTAGRSGSGGDESATMTRTFLDNFTSRRGRGRLEGLLGHRVFDRSGQLLTRDGESQPEALARTIEQAYARSGGSADKFLTGIAGTETRSRSLGDQLFRDLRAHGGRATDLRALMTGVGGATAANTIDPAANAMHSTNAVQDAIRANRAFYNITGQQYGYAAFNRRAVDEFAANNPRLGAIVNNPYIRPMLMGAVDVMSGAGAASDPRSLVSNGRMNTVGDFIRRQDQQVAVGRYEQQTSWIQRMLMPADVQQAQIAHMTEQLNTESTRGMSAADLNKPLSIAPASIQALAEALAQRINASSPHMEAHDAAQSRSESAGGVNGGIRLDNWFRY